MSLQQEVRSLSIPAGADLSASQFCFVTISATGKIALPAAGANAIGILQDKPDAADKTGQVAMLNMSGKLKVVAVATIAIGARVMTDVDGKALTHVAGSHVLGFAYTAGVAGGTVEILPTASSIL